MPLSWVSWSPTVGWVAGLAPGLSPRSRHRPALLPCCAGSSTAHRRPVLGTLGPGESPRTGPPLPDGQRHGIDLAQLVNEWPGDLYNVVLLASSESGHADPALARVPPPEADAPLNFKNLAYAIQWWVFGLFAIWMWWKMFRAEQQPADPEPAAPREDAHA